MLCVKADVVVLVALCVSAAVFLPGRMRDDAMFWRDRDQAQERREDYFLFKDEMRSVTPLVLENEYLSRRVTVLRREERRLQRALLR
jgi:hypothetical protein